MSSRSAKLQALNASQLGLTRNELPLEARRPAIEVLNGVVAEMIDLSLAARHAHWNVRGRSFLQLHELFSRINRELDSQADELGERIAALGGIARGTVQAVVGETALDPFPTMATSEEELIDALSHRLVQLASALHHAIEVSLAIADRQPVGRFIRPWVELLAEAREQVLQQIEPNHAAARQNSLECLAIVHSLRNLLSFPFIVQAMTDGKLTLDGAWFSIAEGELQWFEHDRGAFERIDA